MLTPHQSEQIEIATSGKLGLFTGTPGSGKTYSITEWIKSSHYPLETIMCCAPTGKAAVRLTESLRENGLPLEAQTIHRALKPDISSEGWSFEYGDGTRWPGTKLIIGDEWSMVDSWLFGKFLGATPLDAKVILVGDPNQLPPVGHGKPFKDLIESKVIPHGHLTEPHRFSGRIGQVCKAIQDGSKWEPSEKINLDLDFPENFRHFECKNSTTSQARLVQILEILKDRYAMDLFNDVQVLVAVNANSELSRERINTGLQKLLNPDGQELEGVEYRKGDKVICLRNGLKPLVNDDDETWKTGEKGQTASRYVANGEIGIVSSISKISVSVRFYGRFTVRFSRHDWKEQLALAYAITCHKSQGSGWPAVITLVDDATGAGFVCNRPWVYTAISRAEKISITIGKFSRMLRFLADPGIDLRVTALKGDIIEWKKAKQTKAYRN